MKIKKLIPFALSCLLILETPVISQAAELSGAQMESNVQSESTQAVTKLSASLNQSTASLTAGSTLQLK